MDVIRLQSRVLPIGWRMVVNYLAVVLARRGPEVGPLKPN